LRLCDFSWITLNLFTFIKGNFFWC